MDISDTAAVALYAADAGITDPGEACLAFSAVDPQVRDHYRILASAPSAGGFVHADAHFRMGTAHEADGSPCQDYSLSDTGRSGPFAVLSDGCSLSGRTDVGARILGLSARMLLREPALSGDADAALKQFSLGLMPAISRAAAGLGLERGDLDATLGAVQSLPGGGARAFLLGDGIIAARRNGSVEVSVIDWAGNMPGYPGYLAEPGRLRLFLDESEAVAKREGRPPFTAETFVISSDGQVALISREERSAADGLRGLAVEWLAGPDRPDVVAVASDGVFQVTGIEWSEVVLELMSIRAAREGAFATRRMTRALAGFAKRGGRPADDISFAALAAEIS